MDTQSDSYNMVPTTLTTSQACLLPEPHAFTSPVKSVKRTDSFDFYGAVSTLFENRLQEAATFMETNTNDHAAEKSDYERSSQILEALTNFFKDSHNDCKTAKSSCWFTIRMTKPDDEFVIPRWHQDGNYYNIDFSNFEPKTPSDSPSDPTPQARSKYATTFLGPPTLLLDIPHTTEMIQYLNDDDTDFTRSWETDDDIKYRRKTDMYFTEKGVPRIESSLGQIVRFAWGHKYAVVHSEPDMSLGDRVFVSVLFGSDDEIKHMCGFRETKYEE